MKKIIAVFVLLGVLIPTTGFGAQIVLNWQDNSGNVPAVNDQETGFNIERKLNSGAYAVISTTGPNVISATDTTVVQAITDNNYCYRVNAFNTAGISAYTNEVCKVVVGTGIPITKPAPASNLTVK